ncbi:MAG: hypothetical protein KUA35_09895 [Pseudodesulfovibrio sp.]|nr:MULTISPECIES: hypothetical protein [Pseudodesulfovibrio]MBU4191870.1 hypothetical protein [Pseudomonadota bacterium]MBU4380319.1 hypothetical protein [Pseudomonadota bacterium]MBU4476785.1 hypothetical protein [Pseudomonadota bacterium]MBU4514697.1 hypothetical protein [Pseudomonadota bacterium]MBU4522029.1 hypothetical protein [Pseudomonadota bacterium]
MEISSLSSMSGSSGIQSIISAYRNEAQEDSASFIESLQADEEEASASSGLKVSPSSSSGSFASSDSVEESESSEVFDPLDTNEDGQVSLEELQAAMQEKLEKMGAGGNSGIDRFSDSEAFDQLMDMSASGPEEAGYEAYGRMQQAYSDSVGMGMTTGLSLTA